MNVCRYCEQGVPDAELVTTHSYWEGLPFPAHRQCKDAGVKQEAFDCQVIDADCNDCKHFKRGAFSPLQISRYKNFRGEAVEVRHQPQVWNGHCLKFDKPTQAFPKKWTGHECFEHRKEWPADLSSDGARLPSRGLAGTVNKSAVA